MATPFDMTILRAIYQPEIRSGMSRAEVAAVLPRVLDRVNPKGRGLPRQPRQPDPSLGHRDRGGAVARRAAGRRLAAAAAATQIAAEMRPIDHRLGVSLLTLGRLLLRHGALTET